MRDMGKVDRLARHGRRAYLKPMDVPTWFQTAAAVTVGCLVAAAFVYACACAARLERHDEGGDRSYSVPWWIIAAWLLPVLLIAGALWSLIY